MRWCRAEPDIGSVPSVQVYPNQNCLVLSTENITQNWYFGNERSMLIPNCLFRVGGAAMVLSNRSTDYWRAKCGFLPALVSSGIQSDLAASMHISTAIYSMWKLVACVHCAFFLRDEHEHQRSPGVP